MMNKRKTSKTARIKYLFIAPITAGLMLLNTEKATARLSRYDRDMEFPTKTNAIQDVFSSVKDSTAPKLKVIKTIKATIKNEKSAESKGRDVPVKAQDHTENSNSSQGTVNIVISGKKEGATSLQSSLGKMFTPGVKYSGTESTLDKALIIIDGREADPSELSKINAADIQSISVLKGKSATSLYGEKAKDGAILIVSKKKE